jgi:hypothetical protein
VSCGFSKETLALHVDGDLPRACAEMTSRHLATCEDCRRFLEHLRASQSLLKSLRQETISPSECAGMHHRVMSLISERRNSPGWALRVERAIRLGSRRHSYAVAVFALIGIVSASLLAQMRHTMPDPIPPMAVFEGRDTLLRPEGYRDWIRVGPSDWSARSGGDHPAESLTATHSVYIDPSGYREYAKTGRFSEGTLLIWESLSRRSESTDHPHQGSALLLASVKDSTRFNGGWGFFDFTGLEGAVTSRARALPESSGCGTCHRRDAETDHVFTQFYPVLHSARRAAHLVSPRRRPGLTGRLADSLPARCVGTCLAAHT